MALQREQVVQTAEKYVSRGKIEPAIREYRKLLTENPNDINTLNRIGDLYARIQRIDEAVDFFTQIAEQYTTEGFFVKAIAIYKKIIKLDPTRLEVYEKLAELYHKQGLVNEARTQYQVLADYYQKHDNAPSAIAIYQKMAELEPNNPTYHVKLAEIYQHQQLIEKAVGEYRVIAEMMITHGRSQDAAQVYERALDIDSSNLGFINDAVFKLKEAGNVAAAARFLSVATERNPMAARIARLARVDEVEVQAEPEAAPAPAAPPAPAPAAEPRPAAPAEAVAPPPAVEPPVALGGEFGQEESYGYDLAAAMEAAEATAAAAPAAAPESEEIELDLDEVFVLDMEDEAEPTSLVKPPPDMAAEGRLGSAWAQGEAVVEEPPLAFQVEPEALPEVELEAEPAAAAPSPFESVQLPPLAASGEIFLDLTEPELPQLDSSSWILETGPEAPPPAASAIREIDTDMLERTAAELQPKPIERDEDLVSEAEVLAKYGLEEKALERLREALRIRPRNLGAHALMIQIHLDKGRHERVMQLANAMARTAGETRDEYAWPKVKKHLVAAGYRLDGDRVVAGPHTLAEKAEKKTAAAPAPSPPPPAAPPAPAPPPRRRRSATTDIDQMLRGLLETKPKRPAARPAPSPPAPAKPAPAPEVAPPPIAAAPAAPAAEPPPQPAKFNPLEIGEMIEREEIEWLPAGPGRSPAPPSPFPIPSSASPPEPPPGIGERRSPASLDDTAGLSWLDEADRERPAKSAAGSESLFDEEDDFFDLAAELEQELSQEDVFQGGEGLLVQPAEQSLEEIVEGFKKGVAEHLSPTDYDTHFNLGIAYREMGLLDEAIGEFQVAAKDPRHLVLCCSMLGLCFLDKGLPELAVKWYRRGLEAAGVSEEDTLGLLYDLGCAYLSLGDEASAYKAFVDLYGINTNYRDVVARIEELGRS
jgi:tetratricopeptide (TPR) repeat protein